MEQITETHQERQRDPECEPGDAFTGRAKAGRRKPGPSGADVQSLVPRPHTRAPGSSGPEPGWPEREERQEKTQAVSPNPRLLPTLSALDFLFDQTCQACFCKFLSLRRVMRAGRSESPQGTVTTQPTSAPLPRTLRQGNVYNSGLGAPSPAGFSPTRGLQGRVRVRHACGSTRTPLLPGHAEDLSQAMLTPVLDTGDESTPCPELPFPHFTCSSVSHQGIRLSYSLPFCLGLLLCDLVSSSLSWIFGSGLTALDLFPDTTHSKSG